MPNLLVIAASDPSGGAGIEADIKTAAAFGVNALTAVTAVTVQDSAGLYRVSPVPEDVFGRILKLHRSDQPIHAIKIGALATASHLAAAADFLASLDPRPPVVLDPVIRATSGSGLLDRDAVPLMVQRLLPLTVLVTPNLPEASLLLGRAVESRDDMRRAARDLVALGGVAALVKGGHLKDESADILVHQGALHEWENRLIDREFHGTGCALASAIACSLALGLELPEAVERARTALRLWMEKARPGKGRAWLLGFGGIS